MAVFWLWNISMENYFQCSGQAEVPASERWGSSADHNIYLPVRLRIEAEAKGQEEDKTNEQ